MSKRDDFLFAVQTAFLVNSANLLQREDEDRTYASVAYVIGRMHELLEFADRIPDEISAAEAARQFCFFYIDNLRVAEEQATGRTMECPRWCSKP
nr:hypothetical protein [uncultured Sphaerochaeta sp.]